MTLPARLLYRVLSFPRKLHVTSIMMHLYFDKICYEKLSFYIEKQSGPPNKGGLGGGVANLPKFWMDLTI